MTVTIGVLRLLWVWDRGVESMGVGYGEGNSPSHWWSRILKKWSRNTYFGAFSGPYDEWPI